MNNCYLLPGTTKRVSTRVVPIFDKTKLLSTVHDKVALDVDPFIHNALSLEKICVIQF